MHINSYPNRECRKWLKKSELYIQQRCCVRVQDCGYLSERDDHWQRFLARMRTCPRIVIIINSNSKKLRQLNLFYIVYHWILVVFLSCMPLSITKRLRRGWATSTYLYEICTCNLADARVLVGIHFPKVDFVTIVVVNGF